MATANASVKPAINKAVSAAMNLQKFEFPNMLILRICLKVMLISIVVNSNISNTEYSKTDMW